jgi:2-polyprenyl-6-methoxyphenol hydroxylase-like FAD-dependent oxidoreductase
MPAGMSASSDVVIIGAGVAGAAAAAALGRKGLRVTLVDPHPVCPPAFKVEKIEEEQARLLREFGLLERLLPRAGRIAELESVYAGSVFERKPVEQYGLPYAEMVNAFRESLPAGVSFKRGVVRSVEPGADVGRVRLEDGDALAARLIVLSCGADRALLESLGLRRRALPEPGCFVFGFELAALDGKPFAFDSMTCQPSGIDDRISYMTLFRFRDSMRANLFVFRPPGDPWIRGFMREPDRALARAFPGLDRAVGGWKTAGRIECGSVALHVMDGAPKSGVAVIGDALRSVCPATGMGLLNALVDVRALAELLPSWLETPGLGPDKLNPFYEHPRRLASNERADEMARYLRRAACDRSLRWRAHRLRRDIGWRLGRRVSSRSPG